MKKTYLYLSLLILLVAVKPVTSAVISKVDERGFKNIPKNALLNDESVVVTFNRHCNLGQTFLTQDIEIALKSSKFSPEQSAAVELPKPLTIWELESIAQLDECVVLVSKNINVELYEIGDTHFAKQTHLPFINYEKTFDFFYSGKLLKDSVIAIIDNGVDIHHEDLKKNLWVNPKEKNGFPGIDDDGNGYVDDIYGYDFADRVGDPNHKIADSAPINSHGTHVASLAAAVTNNSLGVSGVMAQKAKIMALNVFGKTSYGQITNIDAAIRYAADMGANVINMSLGGKGASASTDKAIKYAISKGVFVVAAAGNNGQELTENNFYTPSSYGAEIKGMVAVGAVDTGDKFGERCGFSNYSTSYVELSAPGCHMIPGASGLMGAYKENKYGTMAGTSMASPVAAGVALLAFTYIRDQQNIITKPSNLEDFLKKASRSSTLLESYIQQGKTVDLETLRDKLILNGRESNHN